MITPIADPSGTPGPTYQIVFNSIGLLRKLKIYGVVAPSKGWHSLL